MLTVTIAIKHKTPKSVLPPYYRTGDSAGELLKSGVNLKNRSPLNDFIV